MTLATAAALIVRCGMVLLFLPFSALDKLLNFQGAVAQAGEVFRPRALAVAALMVGLLVEVVCSVGVVTGVADRICAFVIAGYCAATAVLFKRFWIQGDFWSRPDGRSRALFWDFLKNISLGAGFLFLVVGADGTGLVRLVEHPFASTQPYRSPP